MEEEMVCAKCRVKTTDDAIHLFNFSKYATKLTIINLASKMVKNNGRQSKKLLFEKS